MGWYHKYNRGLFFTAQELKFSIKEFFSKCDQIQKLQNFIFCAVSMRGLVLPDGKCFVQLYMKLCLR